MRLITIFPEIYRNINLYVEEIIIMETSFGHRGNADFFVKLKDGREYSFTAYTPTNLEDLMKHEGLSSFIAPGLVVVRTIDIGPILDAIDEILKLAKDKPTRLDHFGILQT